MYIAFCNVNVSQGRNINTMPSAVSYDQRDSLINCLCTTDQYRTVKNPRLSTQTSKKTTTSKHSSSTHQFSG